MAKWRLKKPNSKANIIADSLKIDETVAQIMINRNICSKEKFENFLHPSLNQLNNTFKMKGIFDAFNIILESIEKKEKITIYGDYDVDGVMSTSILYKGLKSFYSEINYYIPSRELEGYGLNKKAIKNLREAETDLIIACDNGIASLEEVKYARELGMKIIIIDHHEPYFAEDGLGNKINVIPDANAVIDPKQSLCNYPFKMLCAAGICYKFIKGLFEYTKKSFMFEDEIIVLAMIATFCDIVDLIDENRIIVKNGLKIINENKEINLGLKLLMEEKNIIDKNINNYIIGFVIGPCINASGRLEDAIQSVKLFITDDLEEAKELAAKLSELNEKRKYLTNKVLDNALIKIQDSDLFQDSVIVLYDTEAHESIAGIVAGRIKDMFYHPCIILTKGEGIVKGSARSIEGYNLFNELFKCRHLFERFGGHAMAAGISIKEENIETFKQLINENCLLKQEDFEEVIIIDKQLELDDVTFLLATQLELLQPFGKANKEPLFGTKNIVPINIRIIEDKNTILFDFKAEKTNRIIKAIHFGNVDIFKQRIFKVFDEYEGNKILSGILRNSNISMDIVYYIDINEYNDTISVQMKIKDYRINKNIIVKH